MSVFDASTKTGREVKDPLSDKTLPPPASLSWKAITTPTALAGTVGIDCKLVHGDRFQQIDKSMIENYGGSVTSTIGGSQTRTVMGSQTFMTIGMQTETNVTGITHLIVGATNRSYIGAHNEIQIAGKNHTFVGVLVENHASPKQENEPLHVETDAISLALKGVDLSATGMKGEAVGLSTGVFGLKLEGGGLAVSGVGVTLGVVGASVEGKGAGVTAQGIDVNLCALAVSVGFVLDCTVDLNAGLDVNVTTPFS